VRFYTEIGRFAFLRPPLGDLGATYDDHFRFIGKRVMDFLLVLIELISLGVKAEELRANIRLVENRRFCSNGGQLTQNFR